MSQQKLFLSENNLKRIQAIVESLLFRNSGYGTPAKKWIVLQSVKFPVKCLEVLN